MAAAHCRATTLRWDESTVENASKKELLVAIQEHAPDQWLREKQLYGKLRPLLKKTSLASLRSAYVSMKQAVLSDAWFGELEPLSTCEPELTKEPEPETFECELRPESAAEGASVSLTREQVQALAQIGDVGVVLRGAAVAGGCIVQGQLRRSQGRRNGKVLTESGEIVWFAFADIDSGDVSVARS